MNSDLHSSTSQTDDPVTHLDEAPITELDSLRKQLADMKDLNQRLSADFQNYKRRSTQESDSRAVAQKESFIHDLLPALDNLERALSCGAAPGTVQFKQGVEMTSLQFRQLLSQHGIETEESVGQVFDPRIHEAISQRHDSGQAHNTILEVFQRGYRRGEKVIRPAKVVVNDLAHPKQGHHAR